MFRDNICPPDSVTCPPPIWAISSPSSTTPHTSRQHAFVRRPSRSACVLSPNTSKPHILRPGTCEFASRCRVSSDDYAGNPTAHICCDPRHPRQHQPTPRSYHTLRRCTQARPSELATPITFLSIILLFLASLAPFARRPGAICAPI